MGVALNATVTTATLFENVTTSVDSPSIDSTLSERERIRMEFYQTYDLMTGVRIAATLGSFFTMMVLLVLYKSKCKSRADETLEAAITAAVAEEEELEAVLSQTKYDFKMCSGHRQSLGNMSAPAYTRFSSVGGYGGLMNPPSRRYDRGTRGRISLPASDSSFRYFTSAPTSISSQERSPRLWKSYDEEEENELEEVEENEDLENFDKTKFLQVPHSSRFKFNADSCLRSPYYYERRRSSSNEYFSGEERRFDHPNIHVIQATPQISPSESNSGLQEDYSKLASQIGDFERRLAPLASIGSCSAISSIAESENRSLGSDSVFITNDLMEENDTDQDQNEEELSSSKSERDCTNKKYRIIPTVSSSSGGHIPARRFSDSCTLRTAVDDARALPIVTNLVSNASNQITSTRLYKDNRQPIHSSNSTTSLTSNFSSCTTTSSEKQKFGVFSRIAIIGVSQSPTKTDDSKKGGVLNERAVLSKSEPKMTNVFPREPTTKERKALSLKDLVQKKFWNKEMLF